MRQMQYGGQIIGQPQQLQQINRGNPPMPLHPAAAPNRGLLNQHQQHSLAGSLGAGGLSGSPLTNGLQVGRLRALLSATSQVHASYKIPCVAADPVAPPVCPLSVSLATACLVSAAACARLMEQHVCFSQRHAALSRAAVTSMIRLAWSQPTS